jgi:hypothetical protein
MGMIRFAADEDAPGKKGNPARRHAGLNNHWPRAGPSALFWPHTP